jgi:exopolyphosphatase/guanosine-5'-triphosphate,3'-diphosphate pyrophosphatase
MPMTDMNAPARFQAEPVAIVDIGSNSVRLVAYDSMTRAPTTTFNEKVLCGLGRGVATLGFLPEEGVVKALKALRRFRALCDVMEIIDVRVVATAAVRDAANGLQFVRQAEDAIGAPIQNLSGVQEARLAAMGVVSSIYQPDGVVGDLGGGSLELTDIVGGVVGLGVTLPLGGLSLMDISERSPKKAQRIARDALAKTSLLAGLKGRAFYAVGGTWRALARLHMRQKQYPMHVMHNYAIPSRDALEFTKLVERIETEALFEIESVSSARRPLLAYGATVLEEIIRQYEPREIVVSALGVREGLIYESLTAQERARDPLIEAAGEFNRLRSRAPAHAEELFHWTTGLLASSPIQETAEEGRLRHAACLLSDIAWRVHPDYRAEQSHDMIANANLIGLDHASRACLALSAAYRHVSSSEEIGGVLRSLVTARQLDRARILGGVMRVAYIVSAGMPGVLPRAPILADGGKVTLALPKELAALNSDRLQSRLKQFSRLLGGDPEVRVNP